MNSNSLLSDYAKLEGKEQDQEQTFSVQLSSTNSNDIILITSSDNKKLISSIREWYKKSAAAKDKDILESSHKTAGCTKLTFLGARKPHHLGFASYVAFWDELVKCGYQLKSHTMVDCNKYFYFRN